MKPLVIFVFLAVGWLLRVEAANLTVFAASSLVEAMSEIDRMYEAETHQSVTLNAAGSSTLARQIKAGAPADIFFSADEAKMDELEKAGLVLSATRTNRLGNSLVIVVPSDSTLKIASAVDLLRPEIKWVAMGDPAAVPAGIYAREYLTQMGLWEAIKPKHLPMQDVRAALATVLSGNADAGFIYKSDLKVSNKVKVACEIAGDKAPKIRYPVAVLKSSHDPAAAQKFLAYLFSPPAEEIFRNRGFEILANSPATKTTQ
ncbi:MAG TPA: molybdate ABC transporter substrate-binding protein [Candidatus Limnocylindria bacterium]|jgi:molybdate transport system substrate-binding protein|nr:molybdate ABC transporter substrate-binding protein [Candidatus Limnocylindria bacterium]